MSNEIPTENHVVKVVSVDKEAIKISSEKKSSWVIPFQLSSQPDQPWARKFYEVQQRSANSMKRNTHIVNSVLEVEVGEIDDLQKVLDAVKIEVAETNAQCVADYELKVKIRIELEELQRKQKDSTQKFRDDSDKLEF